MTVSAREVRSVLVVDDYEAAGTLYRDVFGLEVVLGLDGQGGRGVILRLPAATLEIVDAEHDAMVDELEAGAAQGNRFRIADEVDDLDAATDAVREVGHQPLAQPVATPWGDRNRRFRAGDGTQLTLYETP
jgi:catechol 2,3-dioxygenase-like lactoylglutathione lyase family enzyme